MFISYDTFVEFGHQLRDHGDLCIVYTAAPLVELLFPVGYVDERIRAEELFFE